MDYLNVQWVLYRRFSYLPVGFLLFTRAGAREILKFVCLCIILVVISTLRAVSMSHFTSLFGVGIIYILECLCGRDIALSVVPALCRDGVFFETRFI